MNVFTSDLKGSGSVQRHWCSSPFSDMPINSEYKAAILLNFKVLFLSGQGCSSSETQMGELKDMGSFFFASIKKNVYIISCFYIEYELTREAINDDVLLHLQISLIKCNNVENKNKIDLTKILKVFEPCCSEWAMSS